jgi:integrase
MSRGTVTSYTYWTRRCLDDTGSRWDTIDTGTVEGWLAGGVHWRQETRAAVFTGLRAFFGWARPDDDPVGHLRRPRVSRPSARTMPDDVLAAAMAAASPETRWLLRLAATTGLRRAELAAVHSDDVHGQWLRVRGKGDKVRRVPLAPDVLEWLLSCQGWAFPAADGGHIAPASIAARIVRATGWNAHSLRHRYAGITYKATRDIRSVQTLLGHASLATTERYLSVDEDAVMAAAATSWAM